MNFKGNKRGYKLNEPLCGYRSLKDDSTRSETRNVDDRHAEPINNRKGSYQKQLTKEDDREIMNDIFGDSLEKNSKKPSNRQRGRVSSSGDVPASLKDIVI